MPSLAQPGSFRGGEREPLVAIPFNRSTPIMYMNGKLLDRAGISSPETWTELREAARLLTRRAAGTVSVWGFESPISWWFWIALVGAAGGSVAGEAFATTLGGEP